MRGLRILGLMGLLFSLLCLNAQAGVLMVSDVATGAAKDKMVSKAYIDKDRMRIESSGKDLGSVMIFRQDKEVFWIIDTQAKKYQEMTKKDIQKMGNQMNAMQEQMKNIPPEQRKMMEKMMKQQTSAMKQPAPIVYKKKASGQKVNQWVCDLYEGTQDGKKVIDMWTADPGKVGIKPEDMKVMEAMAEYFKDLAKNAPSLYKIDKGADGKTPAFSGIPVKSIYYDPRGEKTTMELKEISRQNFSGALFEAPAGYKKEKMNMGE